MAPPLPQLYICDHADVCDGLSIECEHFVPHRSFTFESVPCCETPLPCGLLDHDLTICIPFQLKKQRTPNAQD